MRARGLVGSCATASYEIKALPLAYLIDRQGRVAALYEGMVDRANLESSLRTLIAEQRR